MALRVEVGTPIPEVGIPTCGDACPCTQPELDENQVREQAYYRWLDATNGQPVSQEETDKFWLETENWLKLIKSDQ